MPPTPSRIERKARRSRQRESDIAEDFCVVVDRRFPFLDKRFVRPMVRGVLVKGFQELCPLLSLAGPVVRHDDFFGLRGGTRDRDGHKTLALPELLRKFE